MQYKFYKDSGNQQASAGPRPAEGPCDPPAEGGPGQKCEAAEVDGVAPAQGEGAEDEGGEGGKGAEEGEGGEAVKVMVDDDVEIISEHSYSPPKRNAAILANHKMIQEAHYNSHIAKDGHVIGQRGT